MSERSERKNFFLKRGVGRLTVGAVKPGRLIGGAADRGCGRRCAGAAVVECESGRFLRSVYRNGVTASRFIGGADVPAGARVVWIVPDFAGSKYSGCWWSPATRARALRPAVAGIGKRSRRLRDWRPFRCCDLHWVGGFWSGASFCERMESLCGSSFFSHS